MNVQQVFSLVNSMATVETNQARESFNTQVLKSAVDSEKEAIQTLLDSLSDVGKHIDVRA